VVTLKRQEIQMPTFKPESYNTVSPYLIVSDAAGTIKFLEAVFGAVVLRRFPDAEGRLMHAEVRIDDTVLMLADSAPDWPPAPSHVHVYVADVDATCLRAQQVGATLVQEPAKKDDEDKRGGVKDVGGTTWWIATRVGQ
jgi:PhnB protein